MSGRDLGYRFRAVDTIRLEARLLPVPWQDRIEWLAIFAAHMFADEKIVLEQLQRDLRDFLQGAPSPRPLHGDLHGVDVFAEMHRLGLALMAAQRRAGKTESEILTALLEPSARRTGSNLPGTPKAASK